MAIYSPTVVFNVFFSPSSVRLLLIHFMLNAIEKKRGVDSLKVTAKWMDAATIVFTLL